ncbi:hypothetical protein [Flavobacterium sp. RSSB_23]|uniref:hypothetical protein n=1 Tax=Flavobacterium sp. RSSB_23 TaxID=3447668 RepID=UPI003F320E76
MGSIKKVIEFLGLLLLGTFFLGIFYFEIVIENRKPSYFVTTNTIDSVFIRKIQGARSNLDALAIKLTRDSSNFIYYKANQNYVDLLGTLKKQDTVTLFFTEDDGNNRFEIIQLEKNKVELVSIKDEESKQKKIGYFCLFASIMTFIYALKKGFKQ